MYRMTEIQEFLLPHGAGVQAVQRVETTTLEGGEKGKAEPRKSLPGFSTGGASRIPHGGTGSDTGIHLAAELDSLSILHC